MNDRAAARLDKASAAIEGARRDLGASAPGLAADRAYYAMYYTADALLATRGLVFSSHGAVHGAFGKEFSKTGLLDPKFHRSLLDSYDERQSATYGIDREISEDRAAELISDAEEFLDAARSFMEEAG